MRDTVLEQAGVEARHLPGLYYLPALSIAAVVFFGGRQVIAGHLTIGQFVLFETLLLQLVWPLEALGWITNLGQRALASAGRSFAWLEGIEPLPEPKDPQHLPDGPLGVRFEGVHFAYGGEDDVLRGLDLDDRARRDRRGVRADRLGQDVAPQPAAALLRPDGRRRARRRHRHARRAASQSCAPMSRS